MKEPKFSIENLRVLNCLSYNEFIEVFGFNEAGGYAMEKYGKKNKDLFGFLADLDNGNQRKLYNHFNGNEL